MMLGLVVCQSLVEVVPLTEVGLCFLKSSRWALVRSIRIRLLGLVGVLQVNMEP